MDESGVDFVKKCIQVIESRDLEEQGLYRVVGMQSKVNSVVAGHFGRSLNSIEGLELGSFQPLDAHKTLAQRLATPLEGDVELKTICSALKLYLRTLKEPVFTFKLHNRFIEAASRSIHMGIQMKLHHAIHVLQCWTIKQNGYERFIVY